MQTSKLRKTRVLTPFDEMDQRLTRVLVIG